MKKYNIVLCWLTALVLLLSACSAPSGATAADNSSDTANAVVSSDTTNAAATDSASSHTTDSASDAASNDTSGEATSAAGSTNTDTNTAASGSDSGSDPSDADGGTANIRVTALKGPTAIGMADFMHNADSGSLSNNYTFTIAGSPDEVSASIAKGETDIAAIPANLAAVLYNKTGGKIVVLGVNTLGVLYICGVDSSVDDIADLEGRTIYASGKGATPEFVLTHLLESAGISANIEWKSEHAECVAAIVNDNSAVAMLPQPFASAANIKNPAIVELIDLNTAWESLQDKNAEVSAKSALVTGVTVARKEFADEHPEAIADFLKHYADSVAMANTETVRVAKIVAEYGIFPENVAQIAIPKCRIVLITGSEMKSMLEGYLNVLHGQNPKAIGGELPRDEFYYGAE